MRKDRYMQQTTKLRCPLLIALFATVTLASGDGMPPPPVVAAKTDSRGYIDVWQLRHDVAMVEPLEANMGEADDCYQEGENERDEEDEGLQSPEQKEARQAAAKAQREKAAEEARACVARIQEAVAIYEFEKKALNDAWLPALTAAMKIGDPVAEVILRQCSTTSVLDRSGVESTCDRTPERKRVAVARLKEIGFAPAFELAQEPTHLEFSHGAVTSPSVIERLQEVTLGAMVSGNLGNIPSEATGCRFDDSVANHYSRIITEMQFRVRQAFTFSRKRNQPDPLTLVRQPTHAVELAWGPATVSSVSDMMLFDSILFKRQDASGGGYTVNVMRSINPCMGMGLSVSDLNREIKEALKLEQDSVDAYLKQDPRWAVFLMKRVGHHEWLPYDMQPAPTTLGGEWLGRWVLDKSFEDFTVSNVQQQGDADIYLDGVTPRITIKSSADKDSVLNDTIGCTLRESGALTPTWKMGDIRQTVLGDLYPLVTSRGYDYVGKGEDWVNKATGEINGLEPFKQEDARFRQILMQCDEGEKQGREVVRFLLLANDILVEVGTGLLHGTPVHIRHYRRPSGSVQVAGGSSETWAFADTLSTAVRGIQNFLSSPSVRFAAGIIFVLAVLWFIVYLRWKQ